MAADLERIREEQRALVALGSSEARERGDFKRFASEGRKLSNSVGRAWTTRDEAPGSEPTLAIELIRADTIPPEPVQWLWPGWLAKGKIHVLAGAPGTGKTTLAVALAAAVTRGRDWPDGSAGSAGVVLIWSGEDDPRDTLVPRLLAAGADLERVFFVGDVTNLDGQRAFDPAIDVALLEGRLGDIGGAALLIVDPIVNAVSGDSHKNGEVRRALAPLVGLAQRHNVAVLGVSHFSKGTAGREPTERVTGSLAFGALPRVVMVAAKVAPTGDGTEQPRIFARAKSNIGPDDGGFNYTLAQVAIPECSGMEASTIVWGTPLEGSARELLAAAEPEQEGDGGSARREAEHFLNDFLADGPAPVRDIQKGAAAAGHSWATVKRAKTSMRIEASKSGMKAGWHWSLPEDAQESPKALNPERVSTFGMVEHLRPESGNPSVVTCADCANFTADVLHGGGIGKCGGDHWQHSSSPGGAKRVPPWPTAPRFCAAHRPKVNE
jgi:energy-coupling factor transporter ATP-binding protein EcfA2